MYGGSSKPGRIGGGGGSRPGAAKLGRASFPPPHRSSAQTSRLSLGSGRGSNPRNRNSGPATSAAAAAPAVEEKFSLVAGDNPLAFSLIIRMAPDLVEEIKRVEALGGAPRIKFGALPNNPLGNVIDLGGKEFRFTWSREFGDLCDIYEERGSGERGNGLLVESGCAWRKVNVQRILDESTKNHVKKLSEEAERKHKSRKSIVLEQNTAMKNQLKQYDAGTGNHQWRNFKQKKEPPFKKLRELPQTPPKSAYKTGISSTATAKGRYSSSPLPSPPKQYGAPSSPLRTGNILKSHASTEDIVPFQVPNKDKPAPSSDKEIPTRTSTAAREAVAKGNSGANPIDLETSLITLLMEKPQGMNKQALEKAIGDSYPKSVKKIEPILKKIAIYQAPGRYILKRGVDLESSKKSLSESGSSPDEKLCQTPAPDEKPDQTPVQVPHFQEKVIPNELEEPVQRPSSATVGEEPNASINIDDDQHSPDLFGEKRGSDNTEAQVGSSSDTGSDSDSESDSSDTGSDSGSPSRSRSKSKSPAGSGSGSSSDSESDASSNSKEGSDEDVDIMTSEDDKEPKHNLQVSAPGLSTLPVPWGTPDGRPVKSGNEEKQDDHEFDVVEIDKHLPDVEQDTEMAVVSNSNRDEGELPLEETKSFSPEHGELQGHQSLIDPLFGGETTVKDDFRYEQSDSSERISKGTTKRVSEVKHSEEKSERRKRSKTDLSLQPPVHMGKDVHFPEASQNSSPDRLCEDSHKYPVSQVMNRTDRDGNTESGYLKPCNQSFSGRYSFESKQSSRKPFDHNPPANVPDPPERPYRHAESLGPAQKYSEKSSHMHEILPLQKDKFLRDTQTEDGYANEKKIPRNSKEGGIQGKQSVPLDSHYQKHGDMAGKVKGSGHISLLGSSPKDNSRNGADRSPVVNGKGSKLQREVSDLELGELREPLPEETTVKRQVERKSSFKQSENKMSTSENWISDFSKLKPAGKASLESGRPSSPDLSSKFPSNQEGSNKKRNYRNHVEDLTKSQQWAVQSQSQHPSRIDHPDVGRPFSKSVDLSSNSRQNETEGRQAIGLEGHESNKKATPSTSQQDSKRGLVPHSREGKRQASNIIVDSTDVRKYSMLPDGNDSDRKKRDSSSDENSCSYSKYEKNEPELKGPIKDFSQYKQYVQEYRDKYDSYCSLNKTLESYRTEFQKLGKELQYAKGTVRYYNVLGQLKESYRQCGMRHKRLKKIFVVLHEELKHLKQRIKEFAASYMD